jgi:hypothetical protein
LSRQIRHLEQQIGVRLFDGTPQSTRLTEAGEVFLASGEGPTGARRGLCQVGDCWAVAKVMAKPWPSVAKLGISLLLAGYAQATEARVKCGCPGRRRVCCEPKDWNLPSDVCCLHAVVPVSGVDLLGELQE